MTKQFVNDLARTFNCETHYQGSTNTMFVHGSDKNYADFREEYITHWAAKGCSFSLERTLVWPIPQPVVKVDVETKEDGTLVVTNDYKFKTEEALMVKDDFVDAEVAQTFVNDNVSFTEPVKTIINGPADLAKHEKALLEVKRKELDAYLIANPVDRNVKGCYNEAAERFEVSVDYVRDRYRKLRAKGLVEKEIVNA